jgi:hypothetical protein
VHAAVPPLVAASADLGGPWCARPSFGLSQRRTARGEPACASGPDRLARHYTGSTCGRQEWTGQPAQPGGSVLERRGGSVLAVRISRRHPRGAAHARGRGPTSGSDEPVGRRESWRAVRAKRLAGRARYRPDLNWRTWDAARAARGGCPARSPRGVARRAWCGPRGVERRAWCVARAWPAAGGARHAPRVARGPRGVERRAWPARGLRPEGRATPRAWRVARAASRAAPGAWPAGRRATRAAEVARGRAWRRCGRHARPGRRAAGLPAAAGLERWSGPPAAARAIAER